MPKSNDKNDTKIFLKKPEEIKSELKQEDKSDMNQINSNILKGENFEAAKEENKSTNEHLETKTEANVALSQPLKSEPLEVKEENASNVDAKKEEKESILDSKIEKNASNLDSKLEEKESIFVSKIEEKDSNNDTTLPNVNESNQEHIKKEDQSV